MGVARQRQQQAGCISAVSSDAVVARSDSGRLFCAASGRRIGGKSATVIGQDIGRVRAFI